MSGSNPETGMEISAPSGEGAEGPILTDFIHGEVRVAGQLVGYTMERPISGIESDTDHLGIVIGGFGGFKRTSRALRGASARRGLTTVSFDPLRNNDKGLKEQLFNAQGVHVETLEAIVDDLPAATGVTVGSDAAAGERTLILDPHSMAGLSATYFAMNNPELVFSINYLATVGFGSPTLGELKDISPKEVIGTVRHELWPMARDIGLRAAPSLLWRAVKYYGSNPPQTIGEAGSCLTANIRELIPALTEANIYTSYAGLQHDRLVRARAEIAELVHYYEVLAGMGHLGPQVKADRIASWIMARHTDFKTDQTALND